MGLFQSLRRELKQYLDEEQISLIYKAFKIAKEAHAGQTRLTGDPYITHPIAVAEVLARMRMDPQTIIAAILHDVVEDTSLGHDDIVRLFGQEIANLVDGVTKLTQINIEDKAVLQAENFRKMVMAMARDIRVILVKLADRLHNMRTLGALSPHKRRRIAQETLEIYAPIANRLGMHAFRVELEDLGFAALHPMRYRILKESVNRAHGNRKENFSLIEKEIADCLTRANLPSWHLDGREKHLYSIYKKMRNRGLLFSEVMDIYGFRVVVDTVDTCYRTLGALHGLYKPLTQRFKDYIAIPKANSYQSLHTTLFGPHGVPIEIQIRTEAMHQMAENGIAAHWLYKSEDEVFSDAQIRARDWATSMIEMNKNAISPVDFFENVKIDLFPDEVYVFTPRGSIMELPAGATAVDFAYAIHSDIGNKCIAVKLDRHLVPLSTPLKSGQQVEIVTSPTAQPSPSWLNFVVTGKARSNIKHFLKKLQRQESIELGHRLVVQALNYLNIEIKNIPEENFTAVMHALELNSKTDLFGEVGLGKRAAFLVAKQLAKFSDIKIDKDALPQTSSLPLAIMGTEGMVVRFSRCCRPIPGDPIAGCMDAGHGIIVHVELCQKLQTMRDRSNEYIPLCWEKEVTGDFLVDIQVQILNQRGSLASVALTVAEVESNIENISVKEYDGRYYLVFLTVSVKNRVHLARLIRQLRRVKGLERVMRLRDHS